MRQKPGAHFIPCNNLVNLGSFAKEVVPVRTIIPCWQVVDIFEIAVRLHNAENYSSSLET